MNVEFLLPATKLGQGYIFPGVSDSVHRRGVGGAWSGGCMVPAMGGWGCVWSGGSWWRHLPETATAAGGTHPTGMHSFFFVDILLTLSLH